MSEVEFIKNAQAGQYQAVLDSKVIALTEYVRQGDVVIFPHTETLPEYREQGIAGDLVRYALDDVVAAGLKIDPQCPFVATFVEEHPQYASHLGS